MEADLCDALILSDLLPAQLLLAHLCWLSLLLLLRFLCHSSYYLKHFTSCRLLLSSIVPNCVITVIVTISDSITKVIIMVTIMIVTGALYLHEGASEPGLEVNEVKQVICSCADSSIDGLLVQHCRWDASCGAGGTAVLGGQPGGGTRGAPLTGCGQHLHYSWSQLSSVSLQQQQPSVLHLTTGECFTK